MDHGHCPVCGTDNFTDPWLYPTWVSGGHQILHHTCLGEASGWTGVRLPLSLSSSFFSLFLSILADILRWDFFLILVIYDVPIFLTLLLQWLINTEKSCCTKLVNYELPTLIVLCSNIFHSLSIIFSGLDWCCLANFFLIRAGLWHPPSTGQLQQLSQQLLFVSSKLHKLFHKKYLKQRIYKFQTDSNDGFGTNTLFISILTHCEE